jgi:hypothetical protein
MNRKRINIFIITCMMSLFAFSSEFTEINWNEMHIDSALPRYTQIFNLGENYNNYIYAVHIEYPEFAPMSKDEEKKVSQLVDSLPSLPEVETFLGISRKVGTLDVQFIPIVFQDGHFLRLINCKIVLEKKPRALSTKSKIGTNSANTRYTSNSVLQSGKWVKIRVSDEGVYQLTASTLSKMGFTDLNKVKLYGYGGYMQKEALNADADYDDLEEVPLYHGTNGLLFYANGVTSWSDLSYYNGVLMRTHTNNPYSNYSYYFLTEGDSPLAFSTVDSYSGTPAKNYSTFPDHAVYEKDGYSWYISGRKFYDSYDFSTYGTKTYSIPLPGIVASTNALVSLSTSAGSTSVTPFTLYANDVILTSGVISAKGDYDMAEETQRSVVTSGLSDNNTFKIVQSSGRLDYIRVNYTRNLAMTSTFLSFSQYGSTSASFQISGADAHTSVWRLGTKGTPTAEVKGTLSGTIYTVNVSKANDRYVAVNVNANFPTPTYVEQIENQNLHAIDSLVDMVVIIPTSGKLAAQAERLVEAHRQNDGLKILIVRADQIYNEFSSGTPDATAYRRFLKMLYDRAKSADEAPRYLLLFGDGAWDNRMVTPSWTGYNPDDFLLCFESEESFSQTRSYVMEDYFGLLDDGEGARLLADKVDIGVGRIPARTDAEAKIMVDKTLASMQNTYAGPWKNTICMMGDDGNNNQHMKDAEAVAKRISSKFPDYDLKRIYWDAYTRETSATGNSYPSVTKKLKEIMKDGALVMNYTGHGAVYCLSHEQVLRINDFKTFNSPRVPLWITASCDIMPFDSQEDNIGETAMLNPNGAALAFFGTARTVYSTQNRMVNMYFSDFILGKDAQGNRYRLGDAVRLAKDSLVTIGSSMTDYSENKLHYALLGDPALTLGTPNYKVEIDSINGKKVNSTDPPTLKAGSVARVSGRIVNESGNAIPGFNGVLTSTIYDSETTVTCFNNDGESTSPFVYNDRTKVIFSGSDSIRGGSFTFNFPTPMDINYTGKSGLISAYAINNTKTMEAQGKCSDFNIGGTSSEMTNDTIGPSIFVYLNTPEFADGGKVNSTPYFVAQLKDSDGICTTGNGIGHDLQLSIDDNASTTYILNDYFTYNFGSYTSGTTSFSIPTLSEGQHTLRFRAWDILNNSSTSTLNFVVSNDVKPNILDVTTSLNPAVTTTTFIISYDRPAAEATFSLEIFDYAGRKLVEKTETGVSSSGYYNMDWDLTTSGGMRLPSGIYLYRVGVKCDSSGRCTKTKKIVILDNK